MKTKENKGLTVKKEKNFSEWYTQIIQKADLIEYTPVSGCYVLRPNSYEIWEIIQSYLDKKFKRLGVKNAYFPLFIPESLLKKEAQHVEGFTPKVAWVTHSGNTKLNERLAIRPTSETIMYDAYSKWIRSHKDLPLRLNQWCNIIRWEFENPVPFLRSREFLWQEGHTVHATKKSADKEVLQILDIYAKTFEEMYAVPVIKGIKSEKEKFAGADYTTSIETFLPNGKAIQAATSHALGQNFSKVFNISFLDEKEKKQYPYQNSWGFTTRSIGIMIMMHSDNKGLVLPPNIAPNKVVIIPIIFEETKEKVLKKSKELAKKLKKYNPILDDREEYSPGWKFNEWELKGIPIRIEIGPKDLEKKQLILVRRDTSEKKSIKLDSLDKEIPKILKDIQDNLFNKADKFLKSIITEVKTFEELKKTIKNKKIAKVLWCNSIECEDNIKYKTEGAKILNIPFNYKKPKGNCVYCNKKAKHTVLIAKSY